MKPLASFPGSCRPDFRPALSGIKDTTWENMECKHIFLIVSEIRTRLCHLYSKYCYFMPSYCCITQYIASRIFP